MNYYAILNLGTLLALLWSFQIYPSEGSNKSGTASTCSIAYCQEHTPSLTLVSMDAESVDPGSIYSFTALLDNNENTPLPVKLRLILPAEFSSILDTASDLILDATDTHLEIIAVKIPAQAAPGNYLISLELISNGHTTKQTLSLDVKERRDLQFYCSHVPSVVGKGQTYSFDCEVYNKGNASVCLQINASSDHQYNVNYPHNHIDVKPGETVRQTITVQTDNSCTYSHQHYVKITASDASSGECLYNHHVATEILTPNHLEDDEWIDIPSTARVFAVGDKHANAIGVEISGQGAINEDGSRILEYRARLPTNSRLNTYDEFQLIFLGLQDPSGEIYLGDTNYSLTALTEWSRYARGLGAEYYHNSWAFGGFYLQDRWQRNCCSIQEAATYLQHNFNDSDYLSINYLNKRVRNTSLQSSIFSTEAVYNPSRWLCLQAEVAMDCRGYSHTQPWYKGSYRNKSSSYYGKKYQNDRYAHHLSARGNFCQDSWYYAENYYAGRNYHGYYNDILISTAGIDTSLAPHWRANLSANYQQNNLHYLYLRPDCYTSYTAPRHYQYNGQISYQLSPYANITATSMFLAVRDDLQATKSNAENDQLWAGINIAYQWPLCSFFGSANHGHIRYGDRHNLRSLRWSDRSYDHHLQSYSAFFTWIPKPWLPCQIHYEAGNTNLYEARQWRYVIGASASYKYSPHSYIEVMLRHIRDNFNGCRNYQKHLHAMLRLYHLTDNGHALTARAELFQQTKYDTRHSCRNQYKYIVSYAIPFSNPWRKRYDRGAVEGYLWEQGSGKPVANAIINLNGERTFSDASGHYRFGGISPGNYALQTELLPRHQITTCPQPSTVDIVGGCTTRHDMPITTAGSIVGSVILYAYEESMAAYEQLVTQGNFEGIPQYAVRGLPHVSLTIDRDCGAEIYTTTTDLQGRFAFEGLRPGTWRLTIHKEGIPSQYQYTHTFDVEVISQQPSPLQIKICPPTRSYTSLHQI